ncbi:MAG: ABC transporter permease [Actinobacteria bacterium]|nr:ABC transporter permease [Actinomycetota bacterium]
MAEGHSVSYTTICLARTRAEIKSFFRQRESVVFTLLFPVILLVLFGSIFGSQDEIIPGTPFINYFVAGMLGAGLMTSSFQNLAITIAMERDAGLLKRLRGTPMPKSTFFIGKIGLVMLVSLMSLALLLFCGVVFFELELPVDARHWAVFAMVYVLGVTACTLCGIAFSSIPKNGKSAPSMVSPIAIILQFISGVFFIYSDVPKWLQNTAAVFPLKWMCQGLRYAFLPEQANIREVTGEWEVGRVALVLGVWIVVGLLWCLRSFRWRNRDDG